MRPDKASISGGHIKNQAFIAARNDFLWLLAALASMSHTITRYFKCSLRMSGQVLLTPAFTQMQPLQHHCNFAVSLPVD